MSVMHEPIEDGIGKRGVGDGTMPIGDWKLTGDERAGLVESIVDDFQQIAAKLFRQRRDTEIVQDQELDACEPLEERAFLLLRTGDDELVGQAGQTEVAHAAILAAGLHSQGACDVALAHAGGTGDQDVQSLIDPGQFDELREHPAREPSPVTRVQVLNGRLLRQFRPSGPLGKFEALALGEFVLDEQPQAILEAQGERLGGAALVFDRARHRVQGERVKLRQQRFAQHNGSSLCET